MKVSVFVSILVVLIAGLFSSLSNADDNLARFKGAIGVIPVSSGVGTDTTATTVNRNIVRVIQPPGPTLENQGPGRSDKNQRRHPS